MNYNNKQLPDWLSNKIKLMSANPNFNDLITVLLDDYIERKEAEMNAPKPRQHDFDSTKSFTHIIEDFGIDILNRTMGFDDITIVVDKYLFDAIRMERQPHSIALETSEEAASKDIKIYTAGGLIIIRKKT